MPSTTIYFWLGAYRASPSVESFLERNGTGRRVRWTEAWDHLLRGASAHDPRELGYEKDRWSTSFLVVHLFTQSGQ